MQVKVFEAETMNLALKRVKEALGRDALIVSTRTVKRGVLAKPMIEITAAIEEDQTEPAQQQQPAPAAAPANAAHAAASYHENWKQQKVIAPIESELQEIREQLTEQQDVGLLRGELEELKSLVQQIANRPAPTPTAPPVQAPFTATLLRQGAHPVDNVLNRLTGQLQAIDMAPETAETLARHAIEQLEPVQLANSGLVDQFFIDTITDLVAFRDPLTGLCQEQRRIALIGPTGVGKTTTIAKLAATALQQGARIALITIDTYRIAAVEQLRVYGEIMQLPVEAVYSPEKLDAAIRRHHDKDLILIDTVGRSPRDSQGLAELNAFLGPQTDVENYLVLSTGTRQQQLTETLQQFRSIALAGLIFSKVDECLQHGVLLDLPLHHNLPIALLTNGQRVPEDIIPADPQRIAGFIMGKGMA